MVFLFRIQQKFQKTLFLKWLKTTKNGKFEKFYQNFHEKNQNINEIDISKLTNENILKHFYNISQKSERRQLIHLFKSLMKKKNSKKQKILGDFLDLKILGHGFEEKNFWFFVCRFSRNIKHGKIKKSKIL